MDTEESVSGGESGGGGEENKITKKRERAK